MPPGGGALPAVHEKHKLVFLGDMSVGKTSVISRFIYDSFMEGQYHTIGVDFLLKTIKVGGRSVNLQLWDTAGQERFKCLIPSYIRDSRVAVVVFDVTCRESFNDVDAWVDSVRTERGDDIVVAVVGNKIDRDDREIAAAEGAAKADSLGALYFETSAKAGTGVTALFDKVAATLPAPAEPAPGSAPTTTLDPFVVQPKSLAPAKRSGYCQGGCY
eukprot:TRINITY_DN359_c0_g1_i1.p1 TRINITY_DN359_c0_g1~~TRINITY_DN359_c0_g1_i1.p1  ORF type:complete len:215 (+),score=73.50 TRINITY_DN359_c0_g1_i1:244-888(+)